jgi:hypothetical protein
MFKRTRGYFLLTMLVLTGLAGRMHFTILTTKERHTLVAELKSSRNDFLKTVEGLTAKQLNFKADKNSPSLKEYIYRLVSIENSLWTSARLSLKGETTSARGTVSDEKLAAIVHQTSFDPGTIKFKNNKEALKFYKNRRAEMLRYVHTSTENVRSHIAGTAIGNFDAYQLILLNTIYCKHYTSQIERIKADPSFPR